MELYSIILNSTGLLGILFILVFDGDIRKSRRLDIRFFRWLCVITLIADSFVVFRSLNYLPVYRDLLDNRMDTVILCIETALSVIVGLSWLKFVDSSAFNSPDRIKRRYRYSFIPLACIAVLTMLAYCFYDALPVLTLISVLTVYIFALTVSFSYIRYAWKMARVYAKEADQPLILRLDFFVIPWILCFFNDLIPIPPLDGFLSSLAVILTWIVVRRRYKYLDPDTGFYTKAFLPELELYIKKSGSKSGSVILFETKADKDILVESIRASKPSNIAVIIAEGGGFFLISRVYDINSINYLIKIVCNKTGQDQTDGDICARYQILKENQTLREIISAF